MALAKSKNQTAIRVTPLVFTNSNSIISYKTKCVRVVVDYADPRFSNFLKMKKFIQGLEIIFLQNKLRRKSRDTVPLKFEGEIVLPLPYSDYFRIFPEGEKGEKRGERRARTTLHTCQIIRDSSLEEFLTLLFVSYQDIQIVSEDLSVIISRICLHIHV